jgi:Lipocalin-like domain
MTVRPHPIVGTWSLQSFAERDIKTNALSYPMGEMPKAAVIYTASGHVATIFTATGRSAPAGPCATDAEAVQLFRTMVAFAGRYEIKGSELTYYPEITWNEGWNGTRQTRYFEISDDVLQIRSAPTTSALLNTVTVMAMTWTRAAQG